MYKATLSLPLLCAVTLCAVFFAASGAWAMPRPFLLTDYGTAPGLSGSAPLNDESLVIFNEKIITNALTDTYGSANSSPEFLSIDPLTHDYHFLDFRPGKMGSRPDCFFQYGEHIYFSANDGDGIGFFQSDGTLEGSTKLFERQVVASCCIGEMLYIIYVPLQHANYNFDLAVIDLTSQRHTILVQDLQKNWATGHFVAPSFHMTEYNGSLYFVAEETAGEIENSRLWRSDGTPESTHPVSYAVSVSFCVGLATHSTLHEINGLLYFLGYDEAHGWELWSSDGTEQGTQLAVETTPGQEPQSMHDGPAKVTKSNEQLYFFTGNYSILENNSDVDSPDFHSYLWVSDGSQAGTHQVAEAFHTFSGTSSSQHPKHFTATLHNEFYYIAADIPNRTYGLWKTDGTPENTVCLHPRIHEETHGVDRIPWRKHFSLSALKDRVVFFGHDYAHGYELWSSDGTAANTGLLVDLNPGSPNTFEEYRYAPVIDGHLYFLGKTLHGIRNLWRSDGTVEGTEQVSFANHHPEMWFEEGWRHHKGLTAFNDHLVLQGYNKDWALYATQGLEEGLLPKIPLDEGRLDMLFPLEDMLLAATFTGGTRPGPLFRIESDLERTSVVREWIAPALVNNCNLSSMQKRTQQPLIMNGTAFFSADEGYEGDTLLGYEPLACNGEDSGTGFLVDSIPGTQPSAFEYYAQFYTQVGDVFYFLAPINLTDFALWRSDGSALGTFVAADLPEDAAGEHPPLGLSYINNRLITFVDDGVHGYEPWVYTPGENSAQMLTELNPNGDCLIIEQGTRFYFSEYFQFVSFNDHLLFNAQDKMGAPQLWVTDGTASGTIKLAEDRESANPFDLLQVENGSFFASSSDETKWWKSDGTPAGTVLLPCQLGREITYLDGWYYCALKDSEVGRELFRSDLEYTELVANFVSITRTDLDPDFQVEGDPKFLTVFHDRLYCQVKSERWENAIVVLLDEGEDQDLIARTLLNHYDIQGVDEAKHHIAYYMVQGVSDELLDTFDLDSDGTITRTELHSFLTEQVHFHTADTDADGILNLSELLRLIQFFNLGGYHCAETGSTTEDGFSTGFSAEAQACEAHNGDYAPQDWQIDLSELLRAVQFYNSQGYFHCPDANTEDEYCVIQHS